MRARKNQLEEDAFVEDADGALRSLSRRFPEALAQAVLRSDERLAGAEWLETQVAMRQLRMDRLLHVRVVGGPSRLLHGEWTDRLTREVQRRMGEYHLSVAVGERMDAKAAEKVEPGGRKQRRLESMVVVLRGRKKPWPKIGTYRTTPHDTRFGGAWFYIEAVYQRTVAELEAKGSPFWLAFVPLARDVNEEKLRHVIESLRKRVVDDDFDELVAAMLSMAKLKKDSIRLMGVIRSAAAKEKPMHPFMRDGLEQGMEQGLKKGLQKGRQEGLQQGLQEGLQRALAPLVRVFEWRLGRPLTDGERVRIAKRMNNDNSALIGDAVVNLSREELTKWIAPRKSVKGATHGEALTPSGRSRPRK
jgi:hypothetical protein